jgi:ADP-ribose pyrophosphatase YjhB (NUDIX family)
MTPRKQRKKSPYARYRTPPARKNIPYALWIPEPFWNRIVKSIPLACVDIIFENTDHRILYGWRLIQPYAHVWALPGGRILYRENLIDCAGRISQEYGLEFGRLYLNGVFPQSFPRRSDVSVSLAALHISGNAKIDGAEFSKFAWLKIPPQRLGSNYRRMILKWRKVSKSKEFLQLNRLA